MNEIALKVPQAEKCEARVSPSAITPSGDRARLQPNQPPGRCTRKALAFADEIRRLYAMGYTLEAIRQALSAAGVTVSRSTVHREVLKGASQPPFIASTNAARRELSRAPPVATAEARAKRGEEPDPAGPATAQRDDGPSLFASGPSGEEVAKAFMSTQITNPFLRQKEHP